MSGSFLQHLFNSQFTSGVQMKAALLMPLLSFQGLRSGHF